jgi:alanine dehydrogenase
VRIGVPKEVKDHEYRVAMVPAGVHELVGRGHSVLVETGAGDGSGITDQEYAEAGATIAPDARSVWSGSEMIVKVKEPVASEYDLLGQGQLLFTYLHLAPLPELTQALLDKEITGVAYETITDPSGGLPLLTPMSEVAGRMSVLMGAYFMQRPTGGRGTLLGGVPGVPPGDVVIIGGGIVALLSAKVEVRGTAPGMFATQ